MPYSKMAVEANYLPFVLSTHISISSDVCANIITSVRKIFLQQ